MTKQVAFGILLSLAVVISGKEIKVGGDAGWSVQEYAPITANVGDVLVFEYAPGHTVAKTDNSDCDFANSELLADEDASPFNLELSEPGSITIASDVQGQCEAGMNFQVDVRASDDSGDDSGDDSETNKRGTDGTRLTEEDFSNQNNAGGGSGENSGNKHSGLQFMDHGDDDDGWWGNDWDDDWDDK